MYAWVKKKEGNSKKLSTELLGVLTLGNHHFFMHVKRLYDDEMTE